MKRPFPASRIAASILIFYFCSQVCTATERVPGVVEGTRHFAPESYPWIGSLSFFGYEICSLFVVRHGVAVTAKHCIRNIYGMSEWSASLLHRFFKLHLGAKDNRLDIKVSKLAFDSGENDLAFLYYDAAKTETAVPLNSKVFSKEIEKGTPLMTGGFPKVSGFPHPRRTRVVSQGCRATGYSAPAIAGKYPGKFQDTTCPTWDGDSGGAVFNTQPDGTVLLFGVVTDSFDTMPDGLTPNPKYIYKDKIGKYDSTMFCPLSASRDLTKILTN